MYSHSQSKAVAGRVVFLVAASLLPLVFAALPISAQQVHAIVNNTDTIIGNLSASNGYYQNDPTSGKLGESGTLTLDSTYKYLMDDTHPCQFRWFQIVTTDTAPPNYLGSPPTVPYTDPPYDGWDYQRNPAGNYTTGTPGDDTLPFYENATEYALDSRTNNVGHNVTDGVSRTYDTPGIPTTGGVNGGSLEFQTYIVFFDNTLQAQKKFDVLLGYSWGGSYDSTTGKYSFTGPTYINSPFNIATMTTALKNDGFNGWTPITGYDLATCPECPAWLVMVAGLLGMVAIAEMSRRRASSDI